MALPSGSCKVVVPAQAGTHRAGRFESIRVGSPVMPITQLRGADEWVPAFAGTTSKLVGRLFRLAALVLLLLAASLPARADGLADAVAGLGAGSFAEKEKAVVALGRLGDPRAAPILKALAEDRLRKAPDGRVVILNTIGGTTKLSDAATGQEVSDLGPDSLDRIIVNNRLPNAIDGALGAL